MRSALFLLLVACGDSPSGKSGTPDPNSPSGNAGCLSNAATICSRACACDEGTTCSVEYPPGRSSQRFASQAECVSAFEGFCGELPDGRVDHEACAADLEGAECVALTGRSGVAIPGSCWENLDIPDACHPYAEAMCDTTCACRTDGRCDVGVTAGNWLVLGDYEDCIYEMEVGCAAGYVEDIEACLVELPGLACVAAADNAGIVMPASCFNP
jgi:hypothetical protein